MCYFCRAHALSFVAQSFSCFLSYFVYMYDRFTAFKLQHLKLSGDAVVMLLGSGWTHQSGHSVSCVARSKVAIHIQQLEGNQQTEQILMTTQEQTIQISRSTAPANHSHSLSHHLILVSPLFLVGFLVCYNLR